MRIYTTFLLSALILSGCDTKTEFPDEIKSIEQIEKELVQATNGLNEIDSVKVVQIYNDYEKTIHAFKRHYGSDTLDHDLAYKMSLYKGLKSFKDVNSKVILMRRESNAIRDQLADLKHDLEYNKMDEKQANTNLTRESQIAMSHITLMDQFKIFVKDLEMNYDTLNPIISVIVDSLIQNNAVSSK